MNNGHVTDALDRSNITTWLRDLVRINSVNPGLAEGGAGELHIAHWLADWCRERGLEVELQDSAPGRPNVIARWRGSGGGRSILLTGHTDTVSLENMDGDPLDARIDGDRLYGRGSFDMKGGLAAILGAVDVLQRGGFQPTGDVWLGFVTDEEFLSIGTDALVKRVKPDAAILTEPTGGRICVAHKGFAWLTLTTDGTARHGSLYDEGVDAIAHMGRVLQAMERFERDEFPQRAHPLVGRGSVHASTIGGGLGLSTYPDRCRLQVEHRLLPDQTADDVMALWQSEIDALHSADPNFHATVELDFYRPGYEIDRDAPIVRALHAAAQRVTDAEPTYFGMWAWLDSAILGRAGIPTVILGPGGDGAHAPVEWVSLESVFTCAAILAETVPEWNRQK
jgi:acetylornithine deacetylase